MNNEIVTSQKIIFITGASRSGTTMMNRIFNQHSKLMGMHELHIFGDMIQPSQLSKIPTEKEKIEVVAAILKRKKKNIWHSGTIDDEFENAKTIIDEIPPDQQTNAGLFAAVCKTLVLDAGKQQACEQTPRNIFYSKQLLDAFPNARVVHMVRDPRAVLASQKQKWTRNALGTSKMPKWEVLRTWCNYHPITISRLWQKANQVALNMSDHPRFHILHFESVLENPEENIAALCRFLEIEYEPAMLEISVIGSSHMSINHEQKGITRQAANNWMKILSVGERSICERINVKQMQQFGYNLLSDQSGTLPGIFLSLLRYPVHIIGVLVTNPRRAIIQLKALLLH